MAIETDTDNGNQPGWLVVRECDARTARQFGSASLGLLVAFIPAEYVVHVQQRALSSVVTFTDGETVNAIIAREFGSETLARQFVDHMADEIESRSGMRCEVKRIATDDDERPKPKRKRGRR
jgi:hypothetical protein